ncbi:MAG: tetratricopeptide repeat protein [Acholeplasmataceae bacterium]|jgi:TPR repeat protein
MDNKLIDGIYYFENRKYLKAFSIFINLAKKNCETAQYYIGQIYNRGLGIKRNRREAFNWFLKSAERGYADSQYLIGLAYSKFRKDEDDWVIMAGWNRKNPVLPSIYPDNNLSMKWLIEAHRNGHTGAVFEVRQLFENMLDLQDGIKELSFDIKLKLVEIFKEEYQKDNYKCAYYLGYLYENLLDFKEAQLWYEIGANKHNSCFSAYRLALIYYEGKGVQKNIPKAISLFIFAFLNQYPVDKFKGFFYIGKALNDRSNSFLLFDSDQAIKAYIEGAEINDGLSEKELFDLYKNGSRINEKYNKKFALLLKAQLGDEKSQIKFINQYVKYKDGFYFDASDWLIALAEKGNDEAFEKLFKYFYDFLYYNPMIDTKEVFNFKNWIANHGDFDYQYRLGRDYEYGRDFLEANYDKALYWYQKAATNDKHAGQVINYHYIPKFLDIEKEYIEQFYEEATTKSVSANIHLGYSYGHGTICDVDYQKAYQYYQEAATLMEVEGVYQYKNIMIAYNIGNEAAKKKALDGDIDAMLYKGVLYQYGFEIEQDLDEADNWYLLASSKGSEEAKKQLRKIFEMRMIKADIIDDEVF